MPVLIILHIFVAIFIVGCFYLDDLLMDYTQNIDNSGYIKLSIFLNIPTFILVIIYLASFQYKKSEDIKTIFNICSFLIAYLLIPYTIVCIRCALFLMHNEDATPPESSYQYSLKKFMRDRNKTDLRIFPEKLPKYGYVPIGYSPYIYSINLYADEQYIKDTIEKYKNEITEIMTPKDAEKVYDFLTIRIIVGEHKNDGKIYFLKNNNPETNDISGFVITEDMNFIVLFYAKNCPKKIPKTKMNE